MFQEKWNKLNIMKMCLWSSFTRYLTATGIVINVKSVVIIPFLNVLWCLYDWRNKRDILKTQAAEWTVACSILLKMCGRSEKHRHCLGSFLWLGSKSPQWIINNSREVNRNVNYKTLAICLYLCEPAARQIVSQLQIFCHSALWCFFYCVSPCAANKLETLYKNQKQLRVHCVRKELN